MTKPLDIKDKTFNRLTVLYRVDNTPKFNEAVWHCRCACGNHVNVRGRHVASGKTKSCGCQKIDSSTKHGKHRHPLYQTWVGIKQRTQNVDDVNFANYGARGIDFFPEWLINPVSFFTYIDQTLGPRPKGFELDRKNNNLGYLPGNLHWVTRIENQNNRRKTVKVTWKGEERALLDVIRMENCQFSRATVLTRLKAGWNIEDAITIQPKKRNK